MTTSEAPAADFGARFEARASKLVGSAWFWVILVFSIASYPVIHSLRAKIPPAPRVMGEMPAFALPDQSGRVLHYTKGGTPGFDELNNKLWLVNLMAPKDPIAAPYLPRLSKLQDHLQYLGGDFALVSFCSDATPAELLAIAKTNHNSPRMWKLVAGIPPEIRAALLAGLREALHTEPGGIDIESLDRGNTLVLVDQQGRIRGYYDTSDEPTVREMLRELGQIANHLG
jgi:protein SCO1/2